MLLYGVVCLKLQFNLKIRLQQTVFSRFLNINITTFFLIQLSVYFKSNNITFLRHLFAFPLNNKTGRKNKYIFFQLFLFPKFLRFFLSILFLFLPTIHKVFDSLMPNSSLSVTPPPNQRLPPPLLPPSLSHNRLRT
jgi:hypothetical protein